MMAHAPEDLLGLQWNVIQTNPFRFYSTRLKRMSSIVIAASDGEMQFFQGPSVIVFEDGG